MNNSIENEIAETIKNLIIDHLKDISIVDTAYSYNYVQKSYATSPSSRGIDFDFRYLELKYLHLKKDGRNYTANSVTWQQPLKLKRIHGTIDENNNAAALMGTMGKFVFDVGYDSDTGEPEITLIEENFNDNCRLIWH